MISFKAAMSRLGENISQSENFANLAKSQKSTTLNLAKIFMWYGACAVDAVALAGCLRLFSPFFQLPYVLLTPRTPVVLTATSCSSLLVAVFLTPLQILPTWPSLHNCTSKWFCVETLRGCLPPEQVCVCACVGACVGAWVTGTSMCTHTYHKDSTTMHKDTHTNSVYTLH